MLRNINNQKGFTLLEIMVVIIILGIILGALTSAFAFSLNFFSEEDSQIVRQESLRFVSIQLEKDIRKSLQVVTVSGSCTSIGSIDYCLVGNQVTREGAMIAENIDIFSVTLAPDNSYIDLVLSSTVDDRGNDVSVNTRIFLRKGD